MAVENPDGGGVDHFEQRPKPVEILARHLG